MLDPGKFEGAVIAGMVGSVLVTLLLDSTFWGIAIAGMVLLMLLIKLIRPGVIEAASKAVKEGRPFLDKVVPADRGYDPIPYVDREEFDKVEAASHDPKRSVIVVCGIGGTGKTVLADTFLHHLAEKRDYRVIYPRFVCKRGLTLESIIATLANTFGEPFRSILEETTQTTREKIASLVTVLENTGPYGLFFDDYNEADNGDLREFVRSVARHKGSNILLLLTSRVGLERLGLSNYLSFARINDHMPRPNEDL